MYVIFFLFTHDYILTAVYRYKSCTFQNKFLEVYTIRLSSMRAVLCRHAVNTDTDHDNEFNS